MSKDELWQLYIEKNPHWLTQGIALPPAGMKRLFNQLFEVAHLVGFEDGLASTAKRTVTNSSFVDELLRSMGI